MQTYNGIPLYVDLSFLIKEFNSLIIIILRVRVTWLPLMFTYIYIYIYTYVYIYIYIHVVHIHCLSGHGCERRVRAAYPALVHTNVYYYY